MLALTTTTHTIGNDDTNYKSNNSADNNDKKDKNICRNNGKNK